MSGPNACRRERPSRIDAPSLNPENHRSNERRKRSAKADRPEAVKHGDDESSRQGQSIMASDVRNTCMSSKLSIRTGKNAKRKGDVGGSIRIAQPHHVSRVCQLIAEKLALTRSYLQGRQ